MIGRCGLEYPPGLFLLLFSSSRSLDIFLFIYSFYHPFSFFLPVKCGYKGRVDTDIEKKEYRVQVISGTHLGQPRS